MRYNIKYLLSALFVFLAFSVQSARGQVGDYRHVWAIGVSGGVALNSIGFTPEVSQNMHNGYSFGITARYTSEKYFSTICSIQTEVNISQLGWKEDIKTLSGGDVINPETGVAEQYKRDITYLQIPIMAHLAWGKEKNGINAFINAGPQLGFFLSEKTTKNYNKPYTKDNFPDYVSGEERVSVEVAQEDMPIERKFDYGIAVGGGIEWDIRRIGRFSLEGRYYIGLGNIYDDSKKDEFGKSNHGTIFVKLAYLKDL